MEEALTDPLGEYGVKHVAPGYYWEARYLQEPEKIRATMQAFIEAAMADKASYFHCRVGADRTGYVGFLLESLLGVSVKDSSIDFEMTSFSSAVGTRRRTEPNLYRDALEFLSRFPGGTIKEKAEYYMTKELGFDPEKIKEFRDKVLE